MVTLTQPGSGIPRRTGHRPGADRTVTVTAPGKVNLQLSVGPLRPDGYHELLTVFQAVSLADQVVARHSEVLTVTSSGLASPPMPLDGSNLAARAAQLLATEAGIAPAVHLHLHKRVPIAGGMAGGSADAAAALVACSRLWDLRLSTDDLLQLAERLGSDVPFTLLGGTAVGTGRGERLAPLPAAGIWHWVFALDRTGLSTPDVYNRHDHLQAGRTPPEMALSSALLDAISTGNPRDLGRALRNDIEDAVYSLRPDLRRTIEAGRAAGALGALIAGTGPTCAFLVADRASAHTLVSALSGIGGTARYGYGPVAGPLSF